ncbi:hypothetical protein B0H19DRAFT_1144879 [Mycena capillaripes]|nr:hypothetical protein B0H19DRAFT_1144879 [Mycena capillaripes]
MRSTTLLAAAVLLLGARAENTEEQQAAITDPTAECVPYTIALLQNAASSLPPIGQRPVAGVLANDAAGQAKWNAMKANIPNIPPTGTAGVFANNSLSSYSATDPNCWWTFGQCVTPKLAGLKPDIASVPEPRSLGYGFDDGPNCSHNAFYDYLMSQNQKATMYFIGVNVYQQPLEAQRAVDDGHEVCVHTWSHYAMTTLTSEQAFAELWYTMQIIKLVTGYTPTCWRPPQGDVDDRIRYIAQQLGLDNILWKYDAFDWKVASGQATPDDVKFNYNELIANVTAGTFDTAGAIMLTHELDNFTMQTAVDFYPKLKAAFDHIVPVGVGYNKTHPYVETNYTQPSFADYVAARSGGGSGNGSSGSSGSGSTSGSGSSGSQSGSGSGSQATGTGAGVPLRVSHTGVLALGLALLGAALML